MGLGGMHTYTIRVINCEVGVVYRCPSPGRIAAIRGSINSPDNSEKPPGYELAKNRAQGSGIENRSLHAIKISKKNETCKSNLHPGSDRVWHPVRLTTPRIIATRGTTTITTLKMSGTKGSNIEQGTRW